MNFKRITFLAIFAVTQMSLHNPVSADSLTPAQENSTVTESVYGTETNLPVIEEIVENEFSTNPGELIMMLNSADMYQDGKLYKASQPMMVKNGVSYVAIRSMVDRVGLKLSYNQKTKETIIISGGNELRFKTDSNRYTVNGVSQQMKGTAYQKNNIFMVPLTSITQALHIPYTYDSVNKRVIMKLSSSPVASFKIQQKEVIAGETTVNYITEVSSPNGLPIVEERWEGREEIFQVVGTHRVTYSVLDSNGEWSVPYSLNIEVKAPNLPPVAKFTTDKEEYKMGELITFQDESTDDRNNIVKRDWINKQIAFFKPGPVKIQLAVTDGNGAQGQYEKTIQITNEILYTEPDFNQLFTPIGGQYRFDGNSIPSMKQVPYRVSSEPVTLLRSNSPETVYSEGVVYRETAQGKARFMIHHVNALAVDVKMYVIATNKNESQAKIDILDSGFAGPNIFPAFVGKLSVQRYFQSMQNPLVKESISIAPGESKIILKDLNQSKMTPTQVISLLADLESDSPIEYNVIMIEANKDPLVSLPYLMDLGRDVHNRGTYPDSTRLIEYDDVVGTTPARISLGDNNGDPNLVGVDPMTGNIESNRGNFGVMYKINMNRVAANTLITFNPRGGEYSGMILVNGNIVSVPEGNGQGGSLLTPHDNSVVYRTGPREQRVEIWFTASPGSNLPVNLVFTPLPPRK
ncbi:copper amine oxidase N-terminal domain-containing protein [Paenibacillus sp. CMAA1364]